LVIRYWNWIPASSGVSQLTKFRNSLIFHSGLDPWFDRLTTVLF